LQIAWVIASLVGTGAASAADFYEGKQITIVAGTDAGSGYDLHARLLARHLGRHLPGNPTVIIKNMPGASSLRAANYIYNIAPKDGTFIAGVQRTVPFEPLFSNPVAQFDVRQITWLGSTSTEVGTFVVWHTTPHQTAADLLKYDLIVGGAGVETATEIYARALDNILGAKIRVVSGYMDMGPLTLAMERGEVQGNANWSWSSIVQSHSDWLHDQKIRPLLYMGLHGIAEMPQIPSILELTRNEEERQIFQILIAVNNGLGRPFFLAPGIPADRVRLLETAFVAATSDPEFLDDAKRSRLDIAPLSGPEVRDVVLQAYSFPSDIVTKARVASRPSVGEK
jgi:tripartite-type tricarboxylate transporter receptor subunit TctC